MITGLVGLFWKTSPVFGEFLLPRLKLTILTGIKVMYVWEASKEYEEVKEFPSPYGEFGDTALTA